MLSAGIIRLVSSLCSNTITITQKHKSKTRHLLTNTFWICVEHISVFTITACDRSCCGCFCYRTSRAVISTTWQSPCQWQCLHVQCQSDILHPWVFFLKSLYLGNGTRHWRCYYNNIEFKFLINLIDLHSAIASLFKCSTWQGLYWPSAQCSPSAIVTCHFYSSEGNHTLTKVFIKM